MPKTALFVIDIQAELAEDPKTEIPHAARIREAGRGVLQRARKAIADARAAGQDPNLLLIFVQHEEKPGEGSIVRDTRAWELVFNPEAGDDNEKLVAKTTP
jgi:nicotinamidase-related amidase